MQHVAFSPFTLDSSIDRECVAEVDWASLSGRGIAGSGEEYPLNAYFSVKRRSDANAVSSLPKRIRFPQRLRRLYWEVN